MCNLVNEDCKHPTVGIFASLVNGCDIYDIVMDDVDELSNQVDEDFSNKLLKFINNVDDKIAIEIDEKLDYCIKNIKYLEDDHDLLKLLCKVAEECAIKKLSMDNSYIYSIDNTTSDNITAPDISVKFSDDSCHDLYFVNIIKEINDTIDNNLYDIDDDNYQLEYYDEDDDDETFLEDELEELKDGTDETIHDIKNDINTGYDIYKGYQYDYIKNSYRQAKMLEMCKKM